jgi:RNA polymerase sigma factor (TIGR02999 family)
MFLLVYQELRRLARARLAREGHPLTLQPTGLVHETYLRLTGDGAGQWQSRGHFFAAAAEAMRRILIERARRAARLKRGAGLRQVSLEAADGTLTPIAESLLDLDRALDELEARDGEMAQVVKLRYFAGLSVDETAEALGSSPRSVNRLWTGARAWLLREMTRPSGRQTL